MEQNNISTENTGVENAGTENTGISPAQAENAAARKGTGEREDDYQSIIAAQNAKVEQMFSICFLTPENASVERTEDQRQGLPAHTPGALLPLYKPR